MSLNGLTGWFASEVVKFEFWVNLIVGVWQVAQPMELNS